MEGLISKGGGGGGAYKWNKKMFRNEPQQY